MSTIGLLSALLITLAVLLTLLQFSIARIPHYKVRFETALSTYFGYQVEIAEIEAKLHRYHLEITLHSPQILDAARDRVIYDPSEISLSLDLLRTVLQRQWVFDNLTIKEVSIIVERLPDGTLRWHGLSESAKEAVSERSDRTWQEAVSSWLARFSGAVWITDASLRFHDHQLDRLFNFSSINLGVTLSDRSPVVAGSVRLDPVLGERLRFHLEPSYLLGMAEKSWSAYLQGESLRLAEWPWLASLEDWPDLRSGVVDTESWLTFNGKTLTEAQGRFSGEGLSVRVPYSDLEELSTFEKLHAEFGYARSLTEWVLHLREVSFSRDGREWESESLHLWHELPRVLPSLQEAQRYGLAMGFVRIEDLVQLARMVPYTTDSVLEQLDLWKPSGDFRDFNAEVYWVDGEIEHYTIETKVDRLSLEWEEDLIRLDGIGAHLLANEGGGELHLNGRYGEISLTALFEESLPFDRIQGVLGWEQSREGWRMRSTDLLVENPDFQFDGFLTLSASWSALSRVKMGLNGVLSPIDVDLVKEYYPIKIMPPQTLAWLQESLSGGRVTQAEIVFDGVVTQFPFLEDEGVFQVDAQVEEVDLHYHPDWPPLEKIDGSVHFTGTGMQIHATRGHYRSYLIHPTKVWLDDYLKPVLNVDARGEGPASMLSAFLRRTPLSFPQAPLFNHLLIDGESQLELKLEIPLDSKLKMSEKVDGRAIFDTCRLSHSDWNGVVEELSGEFDFDEKGVLTGELDGRYHQRLLTVMIENRPSEEVEQGRDTLINVSFMGNPLNWLDASWSPIRALSTGISEWGMEIQVGALQGDHIPVKVEAVSNLLGMMLTLPEPIHKPNPNTRLPIRIKVDLAEKSVEVGAVFGNSLAALIELDREKHNRFKRGEVRFGGGASQLPELDELVLAGQASALDLNAWHLFGSFFPQSLLHAQPVPPLRVAMAVNQLSVHGLRFQNLALTLNREEKRYEMSIFGNDLSGTVQFHYPEFGQSPLKINLDRFQFEPSYYTSTKSEAAEGSGRVDAKKVVTSSLEQVEWPDIELTIEQLFYRDYELGKVTLLTDSENRERVKIERFDLQGQDLSMEASGYWFPRHPIARGARTEIEGSYQWQNLNEIMTGIGLGGLISAKKGKGAFELAWNDHLFSPQIGSLEGGLNLSLTNGNLYNVEPGAGRLVGLFNINQILRRISLDFTDFFSEGLKFDRMKGQFSLAGGHAQIDSFVIDGPSAFIDISGRLGLVDRDYDHWITVTPKTSETLPLIGGIMAGNPAIGLSLFVLQQMFKQQLDQITQYSYHVTGLWESPVFIRKES